MPTHNNMRTALDTHGVGQATSAAWFAPNAALSPVSFGGNFVSTVVRDGVGSYTVTLVGLSPKALVSCEAYAFDNANPTDSEARIGLVTITPATKTVTLKVFVQSALGAPALKDVAANAASVVKLGLTWKLFSGRDATGL